MKAILMTAIGNSSVLVEQNMSEPNLKTATEIKVKLNAASVNPVDTKIRKGGLFYPNAELPAVLGCDGAGVVIEIGESVTDFKIGDKVWFCHGGLGREQGNYAEFTTIEQRWASLMPQSISFENAAAAPLILITAWNALFERGHLKAGETVLIHAGAGGVGHVAIQLAKIAGARVMTTISSNEKADFVKSLGADEIIFYNQTDVAADVNRLTQNRGVDLVFDTVGADVFKASISCTAYFGRIVTILDASNLDLNEARMRNLSIGFELMLTPQLRDLNLERDKQVLLLKKCAEFIDAKQLKIHVSHVLPLSEAKTAHDLIEQGHTIGKIVFSI